MKPAPMVPCECFNFYGETEAGRVPGFHLEEQDVACKAWKRVVENVERAIGTGQEVFTPLEGLSAGERARVVTLPESIERLEKVRELRLGGTDLVRIPPQISGMRALASLDLYVSRRLHFLPYEITQCRALRSSVISTRALYGNYKHRPPFPDLTRADASKVASRACSVCGAPLNPTQAILRWITLAVGTDHVPLLVSACSMACVSALPAPAEGYVQEAHVGGASLVQPPSDLALLDARIAARRPLGD